MVLFALHYLVANQVAVFSQINIAIDVVKLHLRVGMTTVFIWGLGERHGLRVRVYSRQNKYKGNVLRFGK
jgi:hypothetical protein